jgi:alkaline phosphatase D
MSEPISRRAFIGGVLAFGVAACGETDIETPDCDASTEVTPELAYPFTLGVASGDPLPDGVVLWTRLTPMPTDPAAMPADDVTVAWELARDESFREVVQCGAFVTNVATGHSVHVDVRGLTAGTTYWYRFHAGAHTSPIGRTRTAPHPSASPETVRFAVACCQAYQSGYFTAYAHMAADDLDFVLFLGDYIYELEASRAARPHPFRPPQTLDEYRVFYGLSRSDPDLQGAHAIFPWIATWDDHEVEDNYAGLEPGAIGSGLDPNAAARFAAKRAAAYQAWWEHMPVRTGPPQNGGLQIYRDFIFGQLMHLVVVDDRQYRSAIPRGEGGGNLPRLFGGGPQLPGAFDPNATMFGADQEAWLEETLRTSSARWNVMAQQTIMAECDRAPDDPQKGFSMDAWDGYVVPRNRLLRTVHEAPVRNFVSIGGDIHTAAVTDLLSDYHVEGAPIVGSELLAPSISAIELLPPNFAEAALRNPHIHLYDTVHRGYLRCTLTAQALHAEYRYVSTTAAPESDITTGSAWVIDDGVAGARQVA